MARIAGADLPRDKDVKTALTYIYGIGQAAAARTVEATNINAQTRVRNLTEAEVVKLREYIDKNFPVEGDLRREESQNLRRLMEIGCYRGIRHKRGLPVRGQRTHTNARTRKGPRRVVGAKRKK